MLKKIMMFVLLAFVGFTSINLYAATYVSDNGSTSMWHREIGDNAYVYFRYNHVNTYANPAQNFTTETNDSSHYTPYENAGQFADFNRILVNPDNTYYTLFEVVEKNLLTNEETIVYQGDVDVIKSYTFYADSAMYFRDQDNKLIYKFYGINKAVKMRWVHITNTDVAISSLPETTGNPMTSEGVYGDVFFNLDKVTHNLKLTVNYSGVAYQLADRVIEDIEFLEGVEKSYYYTIDDEKFIVFYYADSDLTNASAAKRWNGFAIWNLTTNEIIITNRAWILTYIDVASDNKAYGYYYMPEIPVEDLLSVSLTFQYRVGKKGITTLWAQKWSEYETKSLILEKDSVSLESRVPQWTYDVYTGSTVALAAGAIFTAIPGTQFIGIPLLIAGGLGTTAAISGELDGMINGGIDEIEQIIPDSTLTSKINSHYTEVAGKPIQINYSTNKLYKLYLGNYAGTDVNYVEFDEETFTYTEVSWVTNGTVYVMEGEHILTSTIIDREYEANRPADSEGLLGVLDKLLEVIIYIAVVVVLAVIVIALIKQGILTDPKKAIVFFIVMSILVSIIYLLFASGFDITEFFSSLTMILRI
jgi:hypothetical protein